MPLGDVNIVDFVGYGTGCYLRGNGKRTGAQQYHSDLQKERRSHR